MLLQLGYEEAVESGKKEERTGLDRAGLGRSMLRPYTFELEGRSLEFGGFGVGLLDDGEVGVGIFPDCE